MSSLYEPGTEENIVVRIESDEDGDDISTVTVMLAVMPTNRTPALDAPEWTAPSSTDTDVAGLIRAELLWTAERIGDQPTTYHVFAKVGDNPEHIILYCGIVKVR